MGYLSEVGRPLATLDKVMIGLNVTAGGHFKRVGALVTGVHQTTISKNVVQFSKAVNEVLRPQVLHLPTVEKMWENSRILLLLNFMILEVRVATRPSF